MVNTRLTPGGVVLLLLGAAAAIGGWYTGYVELLAVAVLAGVVLAGAVAIPQVGSPLQLQRVAVPKLVTRGAIMPITLRLGAGRRLPAVRLVDQFAGTRVSLDVPPIRPQTDLDLDYEVRASRRGVHPVGPVLEERSDPFGLVVRSIEHAVYDEVTVHPVVHPVRIATRSEQERQQAQLLPRISDDPLGEFRTLREYQPGDDPRTVHWTSSARSGTLLVRDFQPLRRARRAVLLETLTSTYTDETFEEAVDVAASIGVDALEQSIVLTARTRDPANPGSARAVARRRDLLDLLARVQRTSVGATADVRQFRKHRESPDQLFLVMGTDSPLLSGLIADPALRGAMVVVRVGAPRRLQRRLPVPTIDVRTAREFANRAGR